MESEAGVAFSPPKNANGNVEQDSRPSYSIPGILHFIQHEWTRFEMERAHWEIERAELQARIAFLQGERRAQENLKRDLVRRIRMLEYALRQERQKYHKFRYGTDLKVPDMNDDLQDEESELSGSNENITKANNFNYRQGRQILRQYLQEIGYTDKVVELRSARVKMMLGLTSEDANAQTHEQLDMKLPPQQGKPIINSTNEQRLKGGYMEDETEIAAEVAKTGKPGAKQQVIKTTQSEPEDGVIRSFDFLQSEGQEDGAEELDDGGNADDELDDRDVEVNRVSMKRGNQEIQNDAIEKVSDGAEITKAFEFLSEEERKSENESVISGRNQDEWHVDQGKLQKQIEQYKNERKAMGKKGKRK